MLRFQLLGPVAATLDGRPVDLGRRRERRLLALLLLDPGRPVAVDRLIGLMWDDEPPRDPRATLHVHVSRLRGRLPDPDLLVRRDSGYLLDTPPAAVDAYEFLAAVERGRDEPDPARRADRLRAALALWRGDALADVMPDRLRRTLCAGWEETRLAALELRLAAELVTHSAETVAELADLAARYPERERFTALRMEALHRSGRQQEALAVFDERARSVADRLGLDPGPELLELRTAILRAADPPSTKDVPAQLPADAAVFVGREAEIDHLTGVIAARPAGTAAVVTIEGMPGVGKTALATHLAHRLRADYPDGQLFLDLRGFADGIAPVDPADALDRLLRDLGVAGDAIPAGVAERSARLRTELAGRRVLVLLDNAAGEAQVAPLLPASPGCLVLVTSRRSLAGLDNAVPLELPLLSADDGTALLSRLLGDTDRPGLAELVELCGRLPLALRLVSARLRHRPSWTVEQLASRLRDEHARLGELYAGERSVGTTIALSYHHLADEQRALVCTLGRLPVAEVDVRLAAAAAGLDTVAARRLLDRIVDAHLLEERVPGRYRFHDLVRLTARDLATDEDGTATRRRFLTAYLHTLHRAVAVVRFGRLPGHLLEAPALTRVPFLRDHDAAAWLRDERDNLVTVVRHAAEHGDHDLTWQLAATLGRLFPREHRCDEWLVTSDLGARAAAALGKPRAAALMRVDAGNRHYTLGRADLALDDHLAALALADDAGDDLLVGYLSAYTGRIHQALGQADRAEAAYRRALANPGFVADRREAAYTELDLNAIHVALGRYDVAGRGYRTSIDVARRFGDRNLECFAHYNVAHFLLLQGDLAAAEEHARAAVDLAARIGYPVREARGWEKLGEVLDTAGRVEEAVDAWTRAAAVYESVADPRAADLRRRAEKSRWQGR
ncbi:AfsR/SARP family transcriptional regulator [Virgisporangium ochraceum]|uniref:AfsR/SARP family transcriptional regulator n=1 Tax=Virgisporangium ochraceum TaxID=65505 RepID=UPI001EF1C9D4|nr:BTAD domain-containing putative transcriptional regulator [Virgisporangium ochraceum]